MSGEELDLEDLIPTGPLLDALRETLSEVDSKVAEAMISYKFMMQMIGGDQAIPSMDVLTIIVAQRYAKAMTEWNGTDMFLPFMFARLTAKEIAR